MKVFILILGIASFLSPAFGEESEVGNKLLNRSPAAVEVEIESLEGFANDCLETLGSNLKVNFKDRNYREKLDPEIKSLLEKKKSGPKKTKVDSIHFPECYAYANEVSSKEIKLLLMIPKANKIPGEGSESGATTTSEASVISK